MGGISESSPVLQNGLNSKRKKIKLRHKALIGAQGRKYFFCITFLSDHFQTKGGNREKKIRTFDLSVSIIRKSTFLNRSYIIHDAVWLSK